MKHKIIIGCDPGMLGYFSVMREDGSKEFLSIKDNTPQRILVFLRQLYNESNGDLVCVMEDVHAIGGSSAKATFSFGQINGLLKGLLIANHIPYHLVPPKEWQDEVWINDDKVYHALPPKVKGGKSTRHVHTKKTSLNAGRRIFPDVDFRRTPQCIKDDDNKCDSLLICEYGRRRNL